MAKRTSLTVKESARELTGVIDRGCEFEGTLSFEGAFRIGGVFRGKIFSDDVLIVSEGARVSGEINVGALIVSGEVTGTVNATERVEIHPPAVFRGNIFSPSLMVADGVLFEGVSQMTRSPSSNAQSAQ
jgi:cytoskeletal protein CcmA (bactofilin family)